MKEDFLHYIWLHKKLNINELYTTQNEKIEIISFGDYLQTSGPDFFNAQIIIQNQKWAGNIEIHLKSSDWYVHNHENDIAYSNVVLHVVWEHDTDVSRNDQSVLPVLELKNYVDVKEVYNYQVLVAPKKWINCEKSIAKIEPFIFLKWQERLFIERLENKVNLVSQLLEQSNNDWEWVCFIMLSKAFGLNLNGDFFLDMAANIPFSVVRKEANDIASLEALFFGTLNLLNTDKQDLYFINQKKKWLYLKHKYKLQTSSFDVHFFKLRPDNFPTIRLAQLASLYCKEVNLFSKIINFESVEELYSLFNFPINSYWKSHYNFDVESKISNKKLSKNFIDLLILNAIIPVFYAYSLKNGNSSIDKLINLATQIKPEKNTIISKFEEHKVVVANAFDSQSLLQLKKNYCENNKCLSCSVGISILKNNP